MTNYIDYEFLSHKGKQIPADFGYYIVPIHGEKGALEEKRCWIANNLVGHWTWFRYNVDDYGVTYCFELEEDAMAFKLVWI